MGLSLAREIDPYRTDYYMVNVCFQALEAIQRSHTVMGIADKCNKVTYFQSELHFKELSRSYIIQYIILNVPSPLR